MAKYIVRKPFTIKNGEDGKGIDGIAQDGEIYDVSFEADNVTITEADLDVMMTAQQKAIFLSKVGNEVEELQDNQYIDYETGEIITESIE